MGPHFARCHASAVELIVGIVHLIDAEDSLQTTFIKSLVVSYEREPGYLGFYLLPYVREDRSLFRISGAEAVHLTEPVVVILRFGLDERVELVYYLSATYYDNAYRAYRSFRSSLISSVKKGTASNVSPKRIFTRLMASGHSADLICCASPMAKRSRPAAE